MILNTQEAELRLKSIREETDEIRVKIGKMEKEISDSRERWNKLLSEEQILARLLEMYNGNTENQN